VAASRQSRAVGVTTRLLATARYKALAELRRRPAALSEGENEGIADPADDPEVALQAKHRGEILRRCLGQLSREHREIIDLVYYHEKSVQEVAGIVGIPSNTVKTRVLCAAGRPSRWRQGNVKQRHKRVETEHARSSAHDAYDVSSSEPPPRRQRSPYAPSPTPPIQLDPAALRPRPQLLVGALARAADDLADLALGNRHLALRPGPVLILRQLEQGLRQPGRQVQERHVLHLLAGAAQPRAEDLDELDGHVGMVAEERYEVAPSMTMSRNRTSR
jgi:hypothetical protein